jgi:hypothetical protein
MLSAMAMWSFVAQAQGKDPELGTWKLNIAKSSFGQDQAPKSELRVYAMTPTGIKLTTQIVTADGETKNSETTFRCDGKPYPVAGIPDYDSLAATTISPLKFKSDLMRSGQVIGHVAIVESLNHKVLTFDSTYTTASGQSVHRVRVYDRQ